MSKLDGSASNAEKSLEKVRPWSESANTTGADLVGPTAATDAGATSDKSLASQAGVGSSELQTAGEEDQKLSVPTSPVPSKGTEPLTNASDVDALPAIAQVSAPKTRSRRSQRNLRRTQQQPRRAPEAGSTLKPTLCQGSTTSSAGIEANAKRNDNPEAVAGNDHGETATAIESPQPYRDKTAAGNDDQNHKTDGSARTAHRKSTVVDLYASFCKLEQIASDTVKSPQSAVIDRTFAETYRKTLIVYAGTAGFVLVFFIIALVASKQFANKSKFCLTEDCVRHKTLLTSYLDKSLDPCEDFSAYVCSAWHSSSDHSEQETSTMDSLRFSWYERFRDMLLQAAFHIPVGNKVLAMYDTCITSYPSGTPQLAPFLQLLERYKLTWPELPKELNKPLSMIVGFAYYLQSPFWLSVNVLEPTPSGQQRILVSPGSYVPVVRNQHRNAKLSYVKYWEQFLVHLYPDAATRPPMNVTEVENVRDMEGDIFETLYSVVNSTNMQSALFPFSELGKHVPIASASDWVESFQRGLSLTPKLTLQDYIAVSDLSLIRTVAQLLAKYDVRQLYRHLAWLFVQHHSLAAGYEFLKVHYGSTRKAKVYLPAYCAHRVEASYKVLVLALGYYSLFTVQDRRTIDIGFDALVAASLKKVDSADWMDSESKVRVATKLIAVKKAIWPPSALLYSDELERIYAGFPEKAESFFEYWALASMAARTSKWTRDYLEALKLRWNNLPGYVGYNYILNSVELAIAVATPPAYYRNGTNAMLYGGLLYLMATQLVRAIDAEGLRWAPDGTTVSSILTDSTMAKFQAKAICNDGAGNRSVFPEVPALDIAYSALKYSYILEGREPLPLSEDLPADKVFFMTACYLTCAQPYGRYALATDCNKLVQNSEAFSRAFSCPKGSKMNPKNKCSFFT